MKNFLAAAFCLLACPALAQQQYQQQNPVLSQMQKMQQLPPAEREAAMQQMRQQMQGMAAEGMKMQSCMQEAGGEPLFAKLETKAREGETKMKQLCAAGKRDEAKRFAMQFGREMQNDPSMKKMQQCSKGMTKKMKKNPLFFTSFEDGKKSGKHICD